VNDSALTDNLRTLTAAEQSEMQDAVQTFGEAYVLANWELLLSQTRYLLTL
jgi:hypothetical protein